MIVLLTNRPEYRNDIAEEIRLFFGQVELCDTGDGAAPDALLIRANLTLDTEKGMVHAEASAEGQRQEERQPLPAQDRLTVKRMEKRVVKIAVFRLLQRLYPTFTPWGSLTGIRPTKLFRELSNAADVPSAESQFRGLYDVSEPKIALAREICGVQRPVIESVQPRDIDVYVNIPFCRTKCLYCSFPSQILGKEDVLTSYLETLFLDMEAGAELVAARGYRLRCMYVGGGTPTVLSAAQLDALLQKLRACYGTLGREITVEAGRPDTIDREKLSVLRSHGVDRISINPQSMNDQTLEKIGRAHRAAEVEEAFGMARDMGFSVINMDLIAGLPDEDAPAFFRSLQRVAALRPDNLTVHTLAIKRSSLLIERLRDVSLPPSEDVEAMLRQGAAAARNMGMLPYYMYRQKYMNGNLENVGYARPDALCLYNIDMMEETTNILAHGASAMSKRVYGCENRVERIPNPKDIKTYCGKLSEILAQKNALFD